MDVKILATLQCPRCGEPFRGWAVPAADALPKCERCGLVERLVAWLAIRDITVMGR